MATLMKRRDPKNAVDMQARAQKRLAAMEEALNISGRTQEEADQDAAIDAIFAGEDEEEDDRNWIDKLFDMMSK